MFCFQIGGITTGLFWEGWPLLRLVLQEVSYSRALMSYFCKSEVPRVCVLDLYHWLVECLSTHGLAGQLLAHALNWMELDRFSLCFEMETLPPFPCLGSLILGLLCDSSHSHRRAHPGRHVVESQVLPFSLVPSLAILSGPCFSLDSPPPRPTT